MRPEESKHGFLVINLMTGVATLHFLGSMMSAPILPLYLVDLGASKVELGLIMATSALATILLRVPLSVLAEKIGRWRMLILATLIASLSLVLYSLAPSPAWIYPVRIIQAIPFASFGPLALASIMDVTPPTKRGEIIGRYQTAIGIATMGGPLLSSLLLGWFDYGQTIMGASLLPALGTVALIVGRSQGWLVDVETQSSRRRDFHLNFEQLRVFLLSRNTLIVGYGRFAFSTALNILMTLFAVYAVNDLSFTPSLATLLLGVRGITNTLIRIPAGIIGDRIGRKKPILFAYSLVFLAYLAISEVDDPFLIGLAMAAIGLGWGMRAVSEWGIVLDEMPPDIRELANASLFIFFDVGRAVGSSLGGLGAEIIPIPEVFKIASFAVLSGLLVMVMLIPKAPKGSD